jgi:SAM-dependent methyltransferase/Flp pilus assembly protein TadD
VPAAIAIHVHVAQLSGIIERTTKIAASNDVSATSRIDELFELAFARHRAGELREAEQLYNNILEADPRQLDCLYYLGIIALQDGRSNEAVELIGRAIAANDRIALYHAGIAEAYRALGQSDCAIAHYRKAVAIDPKNAGAHSRLGDALRERNEPDAAAQHYEQAVAIDPELASDLHNLATLYLVQGRTNEALKVASRAIAVKDTEAWRTLFALCVRNATSLPGDPAFRALLIRAIAEPWGRPAEFATAAVALIKSHPVVADGIARAMASWPRRLLPAECGPIIEVLASDELLSVLMDSTPVCDAGLERLLTSVRTILLDAAVNATSDVSPVMIAFTTSLARQCFINEYVFDVSSVERQALGSLRNIVEIALAGSASVLALRVIALAAYMPLHVLDRAHGFASRTWPQQVDALIAAQVSEPAEEARLRSAMPTLTPIANGVSAKVRDQYEENPYPRWTRMQPIKAESGIVAYLRGTTATAPLQDLREPEQPDILIAGCGTGQQSIATALHFPHARVLAIDLSRASLAYAKRKSAGLRIEYAQADILELASLDRRFDVIEASGVLHHLADPMEGWRVLLGLLKPGGLMRLGLYSALARTGIATARRIIAERGYAATPEAIRRARQDFISAQDARFRYFLLSPDFYSTSACRDLLFHVQEHHLTLPQIEAFLSEQNLTLLGFEISPPILASYRARFPDDDALTDLSRWHRFETENPDTFHNMYNFLVRKKA